MSTYQHNTADYLYMYFIGMVTMNVRHSRQSATFGCLLCILGAREVINFNLGYRFHVCILSATIHMHTLATETALQSRAISFHLTLTFYNPSTDNLHNGEYTSRESEHHSVSKCIREVGINFHSEVAHEFTGITFPA